MRRNAAQPDSAAQQTPPMSLSIERIVLDGALFNPLQTRHLHVSIERELTRLLHNERIAPPAGAMARLHAPSLRGDSHADPIRLGVEIARSLHSALGQRE